MNVESYPDPFIGPDSASETEVDKILSDMAETAEFDTVINSVAQDAEIEDILTALDSKSTRNGIVILPGMGPIPIQDIDKIFARSALFEHSAGQVDCAATPDQELPQDIKAHFPNDPAGDYY